MRDMMEEQYVLVPKRMLDRLGEDLKALHQIAEEKKNKLHMIDDIMSYNLTGTMFKLSNRKWDIFPKEEIQALANLVVLSEEDRSRSADSNKYYSAIYGKELVDLLAEKGIIGPILTEPKKE